jgi:hypothetical protein
MRMRVRFLSSLNIVTIPVGRTRRLEASDRATDEAGGLFQRPPAPGIKAPPTRVQSAGVPPPPMAGRSGPP